MNNEKRKGIWIPIELIKISELDWTDRVLLNEIISLAKLPDGCIASNGWFAEFLGIKRSAASRRITKLKELGYIITEDVFKNKCCIGRIIKLTRKYVETNPSGESGVKPNEKIIVVPKGTTGSSETNNTVVPECKKGSSLGKGGSSESIEGSCQTGTNNTSINSSINKTNKKTDASVMSHLI